MSGIVTINIESTDIRFLVVEGKQVKRWGSIPLEPDIVREGMILDHDALCGAINELIQVNQLNKGNAVVSLSGFQSVHRIIDLPKVPRKLLEGAILNEAKRAMPVSLDQLYLSFQCVSEKDAEIRHFFLLGVPQNLLDAEVKCLSQAGMTPSKINLKPLALAKIPCRGEMLIVDIEPGSCDIVVVSGGIPTIMRSVTMHADYSSAERAQHILDEFERTLRFCESSYLDHLLGPETPLFFTGMLAGDEDLYNEIVGGVDYAVEPLPSPLKYPSGFPLVQYAVNIALALKGGPPAGKTNGQDTQALLVDLNILPDVYRPKAPSAKRIFAIAGATAGVGLVFPLYLLADSTSTEARQLQDESNRLQQEINRRQIKIKEAEQRSEELKASIAAAKTALQGIPDLDGYLEEQRGRRIRGYDALSLAVEHVSEETTLTSISQKDGIIDLMGQVVLIDESGSGKQVRFNISLQIPPESAESEDITTAISGWQSGDDLLYEGYRIVLDYADRLRRETDWFGEVQVHFMDVSNYSPEEESDGMYIDYGDQGDGGDQDDGGGGQGDGGDQDDDGDFGFPGDVPGSLLHDVG